MDPCVFTAYILLVCYGGVISWKCRDVFSRTKLSSLAHELIVVFLDIHVNARKGIDHGYALKDSVNSVAGHAVLVSARTHAHAPLVNPCSCQHRINEVPPCL